MIGQWVSACSNAAILADKPRGYLVFGIENLTRKKVGTSVRLSDVKKGGENLENYLSRMVEPRLMLELIDFEYKDKAFSIIVTEPTYDRPVRFAGVEYIRIGENTKRLGEHPAHERAVWFATNRRKFEDATALSHQSPDRIRDLLRIDTYYKLTGRELPKDLDEQIREFCARGFLVDDMEGGFDITNLGAILFAYKLGDFPSIAAKSVRVIRYTGKDKTKSDGEDEGVRGYAIGFGAMIKYITARLPSEESYEDGIRRQSTIIPEVAIREIIANALIHQDFTIVGSGPIIDVYSDRVEVTNPGSSTVDVRFAATMRSLGICEERGGGIDKALIEIEKKNLPPPLFLSSSNSMRVVLFGRRPFSDLRTPFKTLVRRGLVDS
jgi:predicted HTH transcriptional regulator